MKDEPMEEFKINEITENYQDSYQDRLNYDNDDNTGKTVYGQTVLASPESLQRLPSDIYSLWNNYLEGKLPATSKEQTHSLLEAWFQGNLQLLLNSSENNESICELATEPIVSSLEFLPSNLCKRRRVYSEI